MSDDKINQLLFNETTPARLDIWLAKHTSHSRAQIQSWITAGSVKVDNRLAVKSGVMLESGQTVFWSEAKREDPKLEKFDLKLDILFEDEVLLVISKPAGLSMHPGAGERKKTLANALVGKISESVDSERPGIVHRLDKDTTGVVVVAKNKNAHANLAKQFADRTTKREYYALVAATPRGSRIVKSEDSGSIDAPIERSPNNRVKMTCSTGNGRKAVTHWRVIERMSYAALIAVTLETGRTHQIRVHMSSIMCPVVGDKLYGEFEFLPQELKAAADKFGRQALHARSLAFDHPVTGVRLEFSAEVPDDFSRLVAAFRSD